MNHYIEVTKTDFSIIINFNLMEVISSINVSSWVMSKERWRLVASAQLMPDNTISFRIEDQKFQICALINFNELKATAPKIMPIENINGTEPTNSTHLFELLCELYE